MGFGLGLGAEEYDREYKDRDLVRRVLHYFSPYNRSMLAVVLFLLLTSVANSLVPVMMREAINNLAVNRDMTVVLVLVVLTLGLNSLGWVFNYFRQTISARVVGDVVLDLRKDVNTVVLNHDMSFFDKYPTGKIVSRINTDSRDFGQTVSLLMQTISSFLIVFIILGFMLSINVTLTLVVLAMVPIIFVIALSFRSIARKLTLLGQRALAVVNAFVQESFTGIQVTKTFRKEERLFERFKQVNDQSYKANLKRALTFNVIFPAMTIVQGVAMVFIVYFGGEATLAGEINAGDFFLFIQGLTLFFFPLFSIASFWPSFQAGLSASERIFALIDTPPNVVQLGDRQVTKLSGEISFENLTFGYKPDELVFDGFNLHIRPNESVAIVGHTGAGKSSLAKLIARFYEFQGGDIKIDGISVREFDLKSYRSQIGLIPQTAFLWGDTLENNVRYGHHNRTREDVLWALEQAGGADWVEDLPEGLDTNVRERGSLLSMGQRQLVVFARVLLENPSILILDEATASVDPFTETRIQEALEKTIADRTSIIIAHRLWTVRHVDRIIVMREGKVVEEGNHESLMTQGGEYASLYNTYFRHQSLEYVEKAKALL